MNIREIRGYLGFILLCCILVGIVSRAYVAWEKKIADSEESYHNQKLELLLARNELSNFDTRKINQIKQLSDKVWVEKQISIGNARVYQVATLGYGGRLVFLMLMIDGNIKDFELVESKETPGIGDLFENKSWLTQLTEAINTKKNYDAIVGATITSTAIAEASKTIYREWR